MYTQEEKIEMVLIYGESGRNSVRATQLYAEKYPDRQCPSRRTFDKLVQSFCETGSVTPAKRSRQKTKCGEETETFVLAAVANNPHVSCRQIASQCDVSVKSVWKILKRHKFHPYHMCLHQSLGGNDFQNRQRFCEWALHQLEIDQQFFDYVLFTDESSFTNHGQLNTHNMHYWAVDNPHWLRQVPHQHPWSVNVWCGIIGNRVIGPFFLEGNLNGQKYANFLRNELQILLHEVPLSHRIRMWLQQDGCPAHNALIARNVLNEMFPDRWIGRGGRICWPARSPDLTPLDFCLWGYLKNRVYCDIPTTPENMQERIRRACIDINQNHPEIIESAKQSFIYRIQKCMEVNGNHFEHLLK